MTNTTLSTALNHGINVAQGSSTYTSPFTITSTGSVDGGAAGQGVNLGTDATLSNLGSVAGQTGVYGGMGSVLLNENQVAGTAFGVQFNTQFGGSVLNAGIITGATGVDMEQGGYVSNSSTGIIIGGTYGVSDLNHDNNGLNVANAGLVSGSVAGIVASYGMSNAIHNTGTIIGGTDAVLLEGVNAITIENSGTMASGAGAAGYAIKEAGSIPEQIHLIVDPGSVFDGTVQLAGQVPFAQDEEIVLNTGSGHGTITGIGTQFVGAREITIATNAAWDITGNAAGRMAGQAIAGFTRADTIDLSGLHIVEDIYTESTGVLQLFTAGSSGNTQVGTMVIHMSNPQPGDVVFFQDDGNGGTELTTNAICYLRGTRITTADGEKAVEDIRIGDLVPTRFGGLQAINWIGTQSFARRFIENNRAKAPVRISAGALGNGLPKRDLYVSPGHSMLLGDVLVLARNLVNGITITQDFVPETVEYFNFEFSAGHDCVLAEGTWSESFADGPDLRAQFHNVADFLAANPDYVAPAELAKLCAPRPETGPALEYVLTPILARAAVFLQLAGRTVGALEGWVDEVTAGCVKGWAIDAAFPEMPVQLEILDGNVVIGSVLALDYRSDLEDAGKGSGRCAFTFELPGGVIEHGISVRRAGDKAGLPLSESCWNKLAA